MQSNSDSSVERYGHKEGKEKSIIELVNLTRNLQYRYEIRYKST